MLHCSVLEVLLYTQSYIVVFVLEQCDIYIGLYINVMFQMEIKISCARQSVYWGLHYRRYHTAMTHELLKFAIDHNRFCKDNGEMRKCYKMKRMKWETDLTMKNCILFLKM